MAQFEEVAQLIRSLHRSIAAKWYAERPQYQIATLKFDMNSTQDAYGRWTNEIIVSIGDANLDDSDILNSEAWPVWKRSLVHEMLHEFDRKEIVEANEEGRALYKKYRNRWGGPGHDERFYTAIASRAPYFGLSADQLVMTI
jgi:hypothetical protein